MLAKKKANHGRIIPFFQPLMVARPGNHRNFLQLYPKMRNQRLDSWNIWIIHVKKEIKKNQTISSPIFRGISATKLGWENPAVCFWSLYPNKSWISGLAISNHWSILKAIGLFQAASLKFRLKIGSKNLVPMTCNPLASEKITPTPRK